MKSWLVHGDPYVMAYEIIPKYAWIVCHPLSHGINAWYIFAYMYHKNQLNVCKYTSPTDPMGDGVGHVKLNL